MKACKRIEIVIEKPIAPRVAQMLVDLAVPGYTLIDSASGRGDRGLRRADEVTGVSTNCVFIVACDDEKIAQKIIDHVRPLLAESGGICLVSDAHWVEHEPIY